MRFHLRCAAEDDLRFTVPDLFEHVTVRSLARLIERVPAAASPSLGPEDAAGPAAEPRTRTNPSPSSAWPYACPAPPTSPPSGTWWSPAARGIEHFPTRRTDWSARAASSTGMLDFDPGHFGISPHEARLMDPQQRHLLMACVQALAHAGVADPSAARVGLLAGAGENTYFQPMLREADPDRLPDAFQLALHHEKDFLATKAAYHLGLTGPAFTAQSACSSSLVGVHLAAGLLRQGDADVMLVGGVLVDPELTDGYPYRPQHIFSPDGHCRPFSADAAGTVGASGVGVVVLKPLAAGTPRRRHRLRRHHRLRDQQRRCGEDELQRAVPGRTAAR